MKHYCILYVSTLVVMALPDLLWLGVIARDFYKSRMGDLMELHLVPSVIFYLLYVVGILVFASANTGASMQSTLLYGALFGFFAYATYDLTNLATLRGWSTSLTIADIAWGTCVTGFAATGGRYVASLLERVL